MTEDEAKTKWCPFVQVSVTNAYMGVTGSSNRPKGEKTCIASGCMAWRPTDNEAAPSRPGYSNAPKPAGRCGLAGQP